ncbi:MAG TPA: helix-turn-helix domain-containing protein [Gemmataceae bacterium]|nr:helix-turn-helix domain-containing protein [Gemmataceae bacterium]
MTVRGAFRLRGKQGDAYLALVRRFPLTSIQSEEQRTEAQRVIDRLLAKGRLNAGEEAYLDALSDLLAAYEDVYFPIRPPTDAQMLAHLMESKPVSQGQLSQEAGIPKSSISEVLAGKRPFSKQMIRKLADYFNVDVTVLAGNL